MLVGSIPAFKIFLGKANAFAGSSKIATISKEYGGSILNFNVASVIIPSVPSDPQINCSKQYPVLHFSNRAPTFTMSPSGVTTVRS